MDIFKQALNYIKKGFAVFPLYSVTDGRCFCGRPNCPSPGKHPRTKNGVKDASKSEQQIIEWWTKWPDANIGIATGAVSGIIAVDVDCEHAAGKYGDEYVQEWKDEHGPASRAAGDIIIYSQAMILS